MIVMEGQKEQKSEDGTPPEERLQEGVFLSVARRGSSGQLSFVWSQDE